MKKGILGLMTILMVCSCSEKKGEQDKSPTRVQTQIVSSASSDGSETYVGIITSVRRISWSEWRAESPTSS